MNSPRPIPPTPPCPTHRCEERVEHRGTSLLLEWGAEVTRHRWRCEGGHEFSTDERETL